MNVKKSLKGLLAASITGLMLTCAAPLYAATKIMPLGDSITGSPGCWRAYLWEKLTLNNFNNIDMVGTLPSQGCAVAHDGDNEGHGGILATNMANQSQLPAWLSASKPDVVLMHLGTNDVWSSRATSDILTAFTTLVQQMRTSNPNMKIVVAKIIPMDSSRSCGSCANGVIALNAVLGNWASGLSTSASPITVADIWTNFSAVNDTYDGVHPTDAGHKKMADSWYPAVVSALGGTTSSSASSSSKSSSSAAFSSAASSLTSSSKTSSSSSSTYCGELCNWYGQNIFPVCTTTTSGFGFENGKSCVARATCLAQAPGFGGVIANSCNQASSSLRSSSSLARSSAASSSSPASSSKSSSSIATSSSSKSSSLSSLASSSANSVASGAKCLFVVSSEWSTGFTAAIRITNNGTTPINGWTVNWTFSDGSKLTNSWNATVSGTNPYSATNLGWNNLIQPGQSVEIGVQGSKAGNGNIQLPPITGPVCN